MTEQEWTFAMIDLAAFTALTETHGDAQAADLATGFAEIARPCLGREDRLVKSIEDALLLASPTPQGGVEMRQRVLAQCGEQDGFVTTRTGIHAGPAVARGDDFFGAAVNLTARLASHAAGGQVLSTAPVAEAARALGFTSRELGEVEFKSVATAIGVHELDLDACVADHVETLDDIAGTPEQRVSDGVSLSRASQPRQAA